MNYTELLSALAGDDVDAARAAAEQLRGDFADAVNEGAEISEPELFVEAVDTYFEVAQAHAEGVDTFFDDDEYPVWWRLKWRAHYQQMAADAAGIVEDPEDPEDPED